MDFYLLDTGGGVMASSETEIAEQVAAPIKGSTQYTFRVVDWAGVVQDSSVLKSGGAAGLAPRRR